MNIEVSRVAPLEVIPLKEGLRAVYEAAFAPKAVGADVTGSDFVEALESHALEPAFRGVIARTEGVIVGFAYGFTADWEQAPNDWYRQLTDVLGPDKTRTWIHQQFEFPWFGVLPSYQGTGIGGALHGALFSEIPNARSWLVTEADDRLVRRFYANRGWVELAIDGFGSDVPRVILGLELTMP